MLANFFEVATAVRKGGGTISFEWPRYCSGWTIQQVPDFLAAVNMSLVLVDGCAFGMNHKGDPIRKQWRIVTDHKQLLENLAPWKCSGDHKHNELSGSLTPKTAYYNSLMCSVILSAVFSFKMSSHIPALMCIPASSSSFPPNTDKLKSLAPYIREASFQAFLMTSEYSSSLSLSPPCTRSESQTSINPKFCSPLQSISCCQERKC